MSDNNNNLTLVRTLKDVQTDDAIGGIQEIREIRAKLGEFTLRDMTEAVMGSEEYANLVMTEEEGNTKMADLKTEFRGDAHGNLVTRVSTNRQLTHEQKSKAGEILKEREATDTVESQIARAEAHLKALREEAAGSTKGLTEEELATLKKLLGKL